MENNEKETVLHEAIRYNHLEVVKLLIEEDRDLASIVNGKGDSPLFMEVVEKLQALTLEQADDCGWTPLHYAAHIGNEVFVKRFLNNNSKSLPFSKNKEGMSALHIATKRGQDAVIRVLMKSCPKVCELLDNNSRTALHIAVESIKIMVVKFFLERTMAFQDLINLKDDKGNTALHVATTVADFHILRILTNDSRIDKGAANEDKKTFVDIILSNKELQDTEILKIMVSLEIEIVLPPRSEQKLDTRKTNEAESKEKKKDKIHIEEDEAGCKRQTNEAESKEKKKDEIQVEENEETGWKQFEKMVMVSSDKKKPSKNGGGFENRMKDFSEVNLVVATIIAAATFEATLEMPGGYNDQGLPVLYQSGEFRQFLCYDQLAFGLSAASLLLHFFLMLFRKIFSVTLVPVAWTSYLTMGSLSMMVFAFDHGINTVFPTTENHNMYKMYKEDYYIIANGTPVLSICFFLFVILPSLLLAKFCATARRFEPRNSVRIRFGLWS
ncbi:ankyrin repeat-containing protein ITN1-like [Ziziphus jujuba]|uniref:Ankyrin repeat-containing protein ITN1-like n=1 Tax=Ziziphus jujuba TaxID=326968 RepID=A0ABM4AFQ4_ZIZJJ|nr:ankyrin repeat-containing protein ITN1-like [Ziziphus jujuba]